jgi:hypothetical protein
MHKHTRRALKILLGIIDTQEHEITKNIHYNFTLEWNKQLKLLRYEF